MIRITKFDAKLCKIYSKKLQDFFQRLKRRFYFYSMHSQPILQSSVFLSVETLSPGGQHERFGALG